MAKVTEKTILEKGGPEGVAKCADVVTLDLSSMQIKVKRTGPCASGFLYLWHFWHPRFNLVPAQKNCLHYAWVFG